MIGSVAFAVPTETIFYRNKTYKIKDIVGLQWFMQEVDGGISHSWSQANNACSDGWRLPSKKEWESLNSAFKKDRKLLEEFRTSGNSNIWWSSTPVSSFKAHLCRIAVEISCTDTDKGDGYSIRCIRDIPKAAPPQTEYHRQTVSPSTARKPHGRAEDSHTQQPVSESVASPVPPPPAPVVAPAPPLPPAPVPAPQPVPAPVIAPAPPPQPVPVPQPVPAPVIAPAPPPQPVAPPAPVTPAQAPPPAPIKVEIPQPPQQQPDTTQSPSARFGSTWRNKPAH